MSVVWIFFTTCTLESIFTEKKMLWSIIFQHKPLTSATFTQYRIFYCVARTWVVIGCQRDLLLLGRLLWMNLRRTLCKLRLSRDTLVKGLHGLIISGHCFLEVLQFHEPLRLGAFDLDLILSLSDLNMNPVWNKRWIHQGWVNRFSD